MKIREIWREIQYYLSVSYLRYRRAERKAKKGREEAFQKRLDEIKQGRLRYEAACRKMREVPMKTPEVCPECGSVINRGLPGQDMPVKVKVLFSCGSILSLLPEPDSMGRKVVRLENCPALLQDYINYVVLDGRICKTFGESLGISKRHIKEEERKL